MCEQDKKYAKIAKLVICVGITLILLLSMSGCSTTPQTVYVTKEKQVAVAIPKDMLRTCQVAQFDKQKEFMASPWKKRTELMTIYARELQANLENCNMRIRAIDKLQSEQIDIIEGDKNVR